MNQVIALQLLLITSLQTSERWWLCTDGVETGYLPPHCLLVTQEGDGEREELDEEEDMSYSDIDITSILKSESDDESSRSSRYIQIC